MIKRVLWIVAVAVALVAYNGVTAHETQPELKRASFAPSIIKSGNTTTLTIKLDANAPRGGFELTLSTDRPDVIAIPATVRVDSQRASTSVTVPASTVKATQRVNVTVSDGKTTLVVTLDVRPAGRTDVSSTQSV